MPDRRIEDERTIRSLRWNGQLSTVAEGMGRIFAIVLFARPIDRNEINLHRL